jgi:putative SOS response-associated peptidase YedK
MCGRYSITIDKTTIEYHFNARPASGQAEFEPTYNAAPSQLLHVITTYAPSAIVLAKWASFRKNGTTPRCVRKTTRALRPRQTSRCSDPLTPAGTAWS